MAASLLMKGEADEIKGAARTAVLMGSDRHGAQQTTMPVRTNGFVSCDQGTDLTAPLAQQT
ncbi:hypothetical protein Bpfe_005946, partial [Biomphalaria pfeifferi]